MKSLALKVTSILFVLATTLGYANHPSEKENLKKQTIKVALLLDTSNSMDGLINQAKAQLWEIVNELSYAKYGMQKPDLEIALYEYGNSNLPPREGFIRQVLQFSNDLDEISEKLFSLTTNGGNEFCGQVIQTSLKELDWGNNKNDLKLLFIAGNEPFTQGKINYKDAITDAKEKDVVINTIFCGNYSNGISGMWKDGADLGGGDYLTINQDKKVVHIITPYDNDIIILNKKLNATYVYFGTAGYAKYSNQKEQDINAIEMDEVVAVKRAVSKSSRLYENANWDLIDADKKGKVDYKTIEKNKLPKSLQNKSEAELKNYVKQKAKERAEIQEKIKELDAKRRSFIAKKQKEGTQKDVLNNVMIKAIKRQAKLKNYSW
ncbi:vWA domain-containing protein [Polaribacter sp. M15]